jgi:hypothetical protein
MEDKELTNVIKSCLRKSLNYTETRDFLLDSGEYNQADVIKILQREYVKYKTRVSRTSMVAGLILLTVFPLVRWYFKHDETGFEISYKPMVFGVVIILTSFISLQRAKEAVRRFEEFR